MRTIARTALPLLLMAGMACTPSENEGAAEPGIDGVTLELSPRTASAQPMASEEGGGMDRVETGLLASETPGGRPVTLTLDPDPPPEGSLTLHFQVEDGESLAGDLSVDLVAPRMPAHGIRRFPAHRDGDGRWRSEIRIPMEGLWAVYLNLDWGEESAPFEFEVVGTEDGTHNHHSDSTHEHH